ncbi:MAG: GNAT family N-acetyltransferase [Armatimonadetes bacterium]|nr:GNAT family N-acetyltransferase [Armatimonadota bacterium]
MNQAARENILATYLGLASSLTEAVLRFREPYTLVSGPTDLSFCNFAAGFEIDKDLEKHMVWLANYAAETTGFWVFAMTGDEPSDLAALLEQAGFEKRQAMTQMTCATPQLRLVPQMDEAMAPYDRRDIARFMADQFFHRTGDESRARIASATAGSPHRLFGHKDKGGVASAVMVSSTPAALGLYNLCVRPDVREVGHGSDAVEFVMSVAAQAGKPVVLQCAADLVPWYQRRGFEPTGRIEAYTYPRTVPWPVI